jgi:hypothetical protein
MYLFEVPENPPLHAHKDPSVLILRTNETHTQDTAKGGREFRLTERQSRWYTQLPLFYNGLMANIVFALNPLHLRLRL